MQQQNDALLIYQTPLSIPLNALNPFVGKIAKKMYLQAKTAYYIIQKDWDMRFKQENVMDRFFTIINWEKVNDSPVKPDREFLCDQPYDVFALSLESVK